MAENDNITKDDVLRLDNPDMKISYADFSHIYVNNSDVSLYFGIQSPDGEIGKVKLDNRIIVTHDTFIKMMEFWAPRYSALTKLYGDNPRSLADFGKEEIARAFSFLHGQQDQEDTNE